MGVNVVSVTVQVPNVRAAWPLLARQQANSARNANRANEFIKATTHCLCQAIIPQHQAPECADRRYGSEGTSTHSQEEDKGDRPR